MIALIAMVAAASIHVECPLPSSDGKPILWQITLNEGEGLADVIIGPLDPERLKAVFLPEAVRFYLDGGRLNGIPVQGMKIEVSRVNLKIARYSAGNDAPPDIAQCKLIKTKPLAF